LRMGKAGTIAGQTPAGSCYIVASDISVAALTIQPGPTTQLQMALRQRPHRKTSPQQFRIEQFFWLPASDLCDLWQHNQHRCASDRQCSLC
jgi:hypothetical protein